jgi:hypothetical protein
MGRPYLGAIERSDERSDAPVTCNWAAKFMPKLTAPRQRKCHSMRYLAIECTLRAFRRKPCGDATKSVKLLST